MFSWALMHLADRTFLFWHSEYAMAASMPAGMLHWSMLSFPIGVTMYVNTFVAQHHGARQPEKIGAPVWEGVRVGIYSIPVFLATIPLAPFIFRWANHPPELQPLESLYYQVLAFGGGAAVISGALSAFFTGRGASRVVMVIDCTAVVVNLVLDYVWIFGHAGFPALGIEGAAWATVAAQFVKLTMYVFAVRIAARSGDFGFTTGRRSDFRLLGKLLYYGGSNGMQMMIEASAFTVFTLLVGRLGAASVAATTMAWNVNAVAFVPLIGLGTAVSALVGREIGGGRIGGAERATWSAMMLALVYTSVFAFGYLMLPGLFLFTYSYGAGEDFEEVRSLAVVLLRFVGAYCLFDAINMVFVSAIKGAGDTFFILVNTVVVSIVFLGAGWAGVEYFDAGIIWCWWVLTAWICTLGIVYFLRFQFGAWRTMRVID